MNRNAAGIYNPLFSIFFASESVLLVLKRSFYVTQGLRVKLAPKVFLFDRISSYSYSHICMETFIGMHALLYAASLHFKSTSAALKEKIC